LAWNCIKRDSWHGWRTARTPDKREVFGKSWWGERPREPLKLKAHDGSRGRSPHQYALDKAGGPTHRANIQTGGTAMAQFNTRLSLVTTMKTFVFLFLSCASLFGADEGIRVVTTTKTNAQSDVVLTLAVFTRDGQTNLVRSTLTRHGKDESPSYKFYHDGFLVGEISSVADFSVFKGAADCPYSLEGYYRNGSIWQACICTKDGVIVDYFTATNGLVWPAPRSDLQNVNKMTTATSRERAKLMEHIPK
jgi:hypothetical protein